MAPANVEARLFYTALFAALLAYGIVVVNAYTRLSDGGPNSIAWPDHGSEQVAATMSPKSESPPEPVAQLRYSERPWEQRVHPFLSAALAVLAIRLVYLGWQLGSGKVNRQLAVPLMTFVLLFTLILPDIIHNETRVRPWMLMVQTVGALTILTLLWWLAMRQQRVWKSAAESALTRGLRPRVVVAFVIVVIQVALGAWSNVNQAGLPCADFPTCQGVWWPTIELGSVFAATAVPGNEAPSAFALAVHMLHRAVGLMTVIYVGWLATHIFLVCVEGSLCRYGLFVAIFLVCQVSLGIMAVVTHLPTTTVLAHSAVSALLLLSIVTLYHVVRPPEMAKRTTTKQ